MIHGGNLIRAANRSNKFHWQFSFALANSLRVGKEKQSRHRRKSAARRLFVGRQQRRNEMARRKLAAHLDGLHALSSRRIFSSRGFTLHELAWRIQTARARATPPTLAARRLESGRLRRRI